MKLLDGAPLVLDGGLATELERRGNDLGGGLWSARLINAAPEEIIAAHRAFYAAGAQIATTASYQLSFSGFAARGFTVHETELALRRSVELAAAARAEFTDGRARWIAASVGPYGAALADGSEYRGRYGLSVAALARWHRPRLEVLAQAGADVLALETVPDLIEGEALLRAIVGLGVPAWLSYTISGDRTRAGQSLADAFAIANGVKEIIAVGVNCCAPKDVLPAIEIAARASGKPVIVYPNSGEEWTGTGWSGNSRFHAELSGDWVAAGAGIIGGCCRIAPSDISTIAAVLGRYQQ